MWLSNNVRKCNQCGGHGMKMCVKKKKMRNEEMTLTDS